MKHYSIGYSQGTFDLFHVGHLNLLERAKAYCDTLIVGVNSDELVAEYKGKPPIVQDADRCRIVGALKCVDECRIVKTLDKVAVLQNIPYDVIFIGDDWRGNPRWTSTETALAQYGVEVLFLPYTDGISSTALRLLMSKTES